MKKLSLLILLIITISCNKKIQSVRYSLDLLYKIEYVEEITTDSVLKAITIKTYICNDPRVLELNLIENIKDEFVVNNWNFFYHTTKDDFMFSESFIKTDFKYIKQNEIKILFDNNKDVKSSGNFDYKDWTKKAIFPSIDYQKNSFDRNRYMLPNYNFNFLVNSSLIQVYFLSDQLYDAFGIKDSALVKEIFKNNHLDSLRYGN